MAMPLRKTSNFFSSDRRLLLHHVSSVLPGLLLPARGIATKLFVGGLSLYTSEKNLTETFSQYGQVVEAKILKERGSDRSKGFGFITYASEDEAQKAIEGVNGKELNGRVLFVDIAKARHTFGKEGYVVARGPSEHEVVSMENGSTTSIRKLSNREKDPSSYNCM